MYKDIDWKQRDIEEAERYILTIEAAKLLATNNDFGCEIHIAGLVIGVCKNENIVPILEYNKKEAEKFLAGEPNDYE